MECPNETINSKTSVRQGHILRVAFNNLLTMNGNNSFLLSATWRVPQRLQRLRWASFIQHEVSCFQRNYVDCIRSKFALLEYDCVPYILKERGAKENFSTSHEILAPSGEGKHSSQVKPWVALFGVTRIKRSSQQLGLRLAHVHTCCSNAFMGPYDNLFTTPISSWTSGSRGGKEGRVSYVFPGINTAPSLVFARFLRSFFKHKFLLLLAVLVI